MLFLHHSNDINTLKQHLLEQLSIGSAYVLQPQQILVQNPGMKRWLQQQICNSNGIAANIEFPLPSRFIWDIFVAQFDDIPELSSFDAEVLRWSMLQTLQQHVDDTELAALKAYQQQGNADLAGFQLSQKLAGLFDQYLVYRPQMMSAWEKQKTPLPAIESWQAHLWRLLRAQSDQPHRAQLIQRLVAEISSDRFRRQALPSELYVFALSAMSPMYMNVLAALSQHLDVHIFIVNPCRFYWGDIRSRKDQIKQGELPMVENELLASLGKQGRDYIDQFYDSGFECIDREHFSEIVPDSLLNMVKHDILNFTQTSPDFDVEQDDSIQLVSCYSELRELQVLHDYLLSQLDRNLELQPHDIVVMCPDINNLAPYIDAVFGQQPAARRIPYTVSDNSVLSSTPLLQTILDWINLPSSRLTANEISAWLELPALQRAYQLDESAVDSIRYWISQNHIHWALDSEHRSRLGFPDNDLNTWRHGISQLLTAYLMPPQSELYQQQVASACIIDQQEFMALGQLQKFLDDLAHWQQQLNQKQSLIDWQNSINAMIAALLQLDEDEAWLIKPLRDEMAAWQQQAEQAGFEQPLELSVIHHLLQQSLEQGSAHHAYLTGGINFCNLIPMRTLPFKVVCLIGMGDQQFPRNEPLLQMDLISRNPQKGDRSRREDDRYMFLQSLLSAQQSLYISYVGRNKQDDSQLEPSVVVSELLDTIEQNTGHRIAIRQSALQPFAQSNFAYGSYAEQWQLQAATKLDYRFNQTIDFDDIDNDIELDELIRFYNNPARHFMQQRLGLRLAAASSEIDDDEPFALDPLNRHGLRQTLFNDMMQQGELQAAKYLNSGLLSPLTSGEIQLQQQLTEVEMMVHELTSHEYYSGHTLFEQNLLLQSYQIQGRIISYSNAGLLQITQSKLGGKGLFSSWIQHCFLCATQTLQFSQIIFNDKTINLEILQKSQAQQILITLIETYIKGSRRILPLYINTAYDYQRIKNDKSEEDALNKIQADWQPDSFYPSYESQDAYITTAFKNDMPFNAEFFQLCDELIQPMIDRISIKK